MTRQTRYGCGPTAVLAGIAATFILAAILRPDALAAFVGL